MARKPQGYWEKRQTQLMKQIENSTLDSIGSLILAYNRATNNINNEIKKIYNKYATENKLTKEEALKLLSYSDTNQHYKQLLEKIEQTIDEEIKQKLIAKYNAPAYAYRITRYQALQENIDVELKQLAAIETEIDKIRFTDTLTEGYYRNIFDIQKGLGMSFNFSQIDNNVIKLLLKEKWNNKMNYSERIWNNLDKLSNYLNNNILSDNLSGKSIQKMSSELNDAMQVGLFSATRLIRTETNFYANQAELLAYEECGIDKYQFIATLDKVTCIHCAKLDKQVFDIKEAKVGVNYPPIHPNDRCTTVAYFEEDNIEDLKRRAKDYLNGESQIINNISYKDWLEKYKTDLKDDIKNDIINEKSNKKITQIIEEAIDKIEKVNIYGYTPKESNIINNYAKELLRYSKEDNNNKEVAFIINNRMEVIEKYKGDTNSIVFTTSFIGKKIFVIHNHPKNSSYSDSDISFLLRNDDINSLMIVKNNGKIEILTKTSSYNSRDAKTILKRQYKKYVKTNSEKEIDKAIQKFIEESEKGGMFEWIKN